MSVNYRNPSSGELITLANGSRMWVGTQAAHDAAVTNGTMPNNCMVCITDDYPTDATDDYSTDETKTFKHWIDDKPIYRKVVNLGNLPNTNSKVVAHGITNAGTFTNVTGIALSSSVKINLPYPTNNTRTIMLYASSTSVYIETFSDRSDFVGYAILEYTKTTD